MSAPQVAVEVRGDGTAVVTYRDEADGYTETRDLQAGQSVVVTARTVPHFAREVVEFNFAGPDDG